MQIALHAGAHATDEDRLIACLRRNTSALARAGVGVPPPASYRKLLRDILNSAGEAGLAPGAREMVLDAIGETDGVARLVLSNPGFFGTEKMALSGARLYPAAEARLGLLRQVFEGDEVALFLGLRDPAMFLPALLEGTPFANVDGLMRGGAPEDLRWSDLVARIRDAFPDMDITVWCNEDTPVIWARILREIAGVDASLGLEGADALLSEIMTPAGFRRLEEYRTAHPGMTEAQDQRVIAAFLDKYADANAVEIELDVPGWDAAVIDRLTGIYDADIGEIRRIDGVRVLAP
ncbi:hypothetical protein [Roseovarius sp. D22-M7]|uniref:hypothetical protein n=1 Tax=Roseovarius sp. D22-M7 TaxID=3127116 RepID=UPI0030104C36